LTPPAKTFYRPSTMTDDITCLCPPEELPAEPRPLDDETAAAELGLLAKALGHPARVKILSLLAGRDQCTCGEVVRELPLAQSTVSEHLRILKEAGLVRGEITGPNVCYCIAPRAVARLKDLVAAL
jgi:ArsR family transcriptional regulator